MEQGALQAELQALKAACQQWKVCLLLWDIPPTSNCCGIFKTSEDIGRADAQQGSTMVYSI